MSLHEGSHEALLVINRFQRQCCFKSSKLEVRLQELPRDVAVVQRSLMYTSSVISQASDRLITMQYNLGIRIHVAGTLTCTSI